jgi:hypothetical protein
VKSIFASPYRDAELDVFWPPTPPPRGWSRTMVAAADAAGHGGLHDQVYLVYRNRSVSGLTYRTVQTMYRYRTVDIEQSLI